MGLSPGTRIGAYEIVSLIGAGGMGEVYRARDPRLGRDVAIKVIPQSLAGDATRVRRFELEARAAAALNSPYILAVHDVGVHDGTPFIVSELLDGSTLSDRLTAAPLAVRKAIEYATQLARGLAAAHEKGIIHRDLKPGNVFLTSDGHLKILDFGLAKLVEREPSPDATVAPTAAPDTVPGVVMGTVGYMSPEQVRGRHADHRADIFAFGAILYEMLSGRRAFAGETSADTLTAILKDDPEDLPSADRHIPPPLERIVDRCLDKNPSGRFQSAGDLAFALEALSAHSGRTEAVASAAPRSRERMAWIVAAIASVALMAALAIVAFRFVSPNQPVAPTVMLSVPLPEGWTLALANQQGVPTSLAASPDGRLLAVIAIREGGTATILIRPLNAAVAQPLAGTDGVSSMFWSPDNRFLGFFAGGKLKKIDVTGGPPIAICDAGGAIGGGTWGRDGTIVFSQVGTGGYLLKRVDAAGGVATEVAQEKEVAESQIRPSFLPDGRHFLYAGAAPNRVTTTIPIYLGSLDSPKRVKLLDSGSTNVQYAQGHLLFLRDVTLMAQPFDVDRLSLTGNAVPVADPVQRQGVIPPYGLFSASQTGLLTYQPGGQFIGGGFELRWMDRSGKVLATVGQPSAYTAVALSPDGGTAVVADTAPSPALWTVDLARGVRSRLTFGPGVATYPVWSPDGRQIVYGATGSAAPPAVHLRAADGSGQDEVVSDSAGPAQLPAARVPMAWSRDGRFILLAASSTTNTDADLWILPRQGDRSSLPWLQTPFLEVDPQFSPDGRWVAYTSNESGTSEVYVRPFVAPDGSGGKSSESGGAGGRTLMSSGGGIYPRWRRDGRELFYMTAGFQPTIMSVSVEPGPTGLKVGAARPLFRLSLPPALQGWPYDVSADGQKLLVIGAPQVKAEATRAPVSVVLNWAPGK